MTSIIIVLGGVELPLDTFSRISTSLLQTEVVWCDGGLEVAVTVVDCPTTRCSAESSPSLGKPSLPSTASPTPISAGEERMTICIRGEANGIRTMGLRSR